MDDAYARPVESRRFEQPTLVKNFYREHPAVAARSNEEVAAYQRDKEVHVFGADVPRPCTTFEETSFPPVRI